MAANPTEPDHLAWHAYPYVWLQYLLPHHGLSALAHWLTRVRWAPCKDGLIGVFRHFFPVNLAEAEQPDPRAYGSFNEFFTRALRADARPLAPAGALLSPVDGAVSQFGTIQDGRLIQAKGHDYRLIDLVGGDRATADLFQGGEFITLYLSPRDYHRIHMPLAGRLTGTRHLPGRLFSVNTTTSRLVPRLFARNERLVCRFDGDSGPLGLVLVGAIFVASIETTWAGVWTPRRCRTAPEQVPDSLQLERGAEMGRFNMGSTVILLLPPGRVAWDARLQPGCPVRMGESLGELQPPS
jgi:phosphatidylserine decarboxylase